MCDNEPTINTLLRMAVNIRLAMGLPTRATTPPAYSHGNSLVENAIGRIRPLARSLTHALGQKVGVEILYIQPFVDMGFASQLLVDEQVQCKSR